MKKLISRGSSKHVDKSSSSGFVAKGKDKSLVRKWNLSDFELMTTLGTGTFGRVRLVRVKPGILDSGKPQLFAMKILKKAELIRLKQVDHIKSEKAILQEIDHPFVVNMFGAMQDEKNLYMLLEFVIGGELFSHLRKAGRFSNEATKFYAASIVLAMQHLHSQDIVYRDLKPENLLLDNEGYLKITDFGFAKKVEDRTWTLCGTPEYLAPEIIQSKGHGKAVDWWALGILIYEMLAGYPPFYDENPFGIYQKILGCKIEFPRHFDVQAKDLIKKLLTPDRSKRIGNLKGGAEDVIKHKWFRNFEWENLKRRTMAPPIKPYIQAADDTRNFDQYPESDDDGPAPPADFQSKNYFEDFDKY
eukprot:Rmarinus@m.7649